MKISSMKLIDKFQKIIILTLMSLMAIVVLAATAGLAYTLMRDILFPLGGLDIDELLSFFGSILLVLIGVELLETFKNYGQEKTVNVQIVFLVALIAMARSIIVMELDVTSNSSDMLGTAAIIASLSVGYYLIEKSRYKRE